MPLFDPIFCIGKPQHKIPQLIIVCSRENRFINLLVIVLLSVEIFWHVDVN